jgi:hypothetical protein
VVGGPEAGVNSPQVVVPRQDVPAGKGGIWVGGEEGRRKVWADCCSRFVRLIGLSTKSRGRGWCCAKFALRQRSQRASARRPHALQAEANGDGLPAAVFVAAAVPRAREDRPAVGFDAFRGRVAEHLIAEQ